MRDLVYRSCLHEKYQFLLKAILDYQRKILGDFIIDNILELTLCMKRSSTIKYQSRTTTNNTGVTL